MITGCIFTSGIGRVVSNSTNLPQIAKTQWYVLLNHISLLRFRLYDRNFRCRLNMDIRFGCVQKPETIAR
jgi:hypothetical protein